MPRFFSASDVLRVIYMIYYGRIPETSPQKTIRRVGRYICFLGIVGLVPNIVRNCLLFWDRKMLSKTQSQKGRVQKCR